MIQWLLGKLVPIVMEPRKGELRHENMPADIPADHHGLGSVVGDARKRIDGGLGGLTDDEDRELSDLLNAPGKVCECGDAGCCNPTQPTAGR